MTKILVVTKPDMGEERPTGANLDHLGTMAFIKAYLSGKDYTVKDTLVEDVARGEYDLVITVGGDGTLLYASHFIGPRIPVLAINSAPLYSEGYFCGASREATRDLKTYLDNWKDLPRTEVTRMEVLVDGIVLTRRALNDALFCHSHPAMTSRYALHTDGDSEDQMSSGVWISTAVGSTAAMRSAGGFTSPHDSKNLQYIVREPFQPAGKRLQRVHGFFEPGETMLLVSSINAGHVYIDGAHINKEVGLRQSLSIRRSEESLTLLNFRQKNNA